MEFVPAEAFEPFVETPDNCNLELCKYSVIHEEENYAKKNLLTNFRLFHDFYSNKSDLEVPLKVRLLRQFARFILELEEKALSQNITRFNRHFMVDAGTTSPIPDLPNLGWPVETEDYGPLIFLRQLEARIAFFVTRKFRTSLAITFLNNEEFLLSEEKNERTIDLAEYRETNRLWKLIHEKSKAMSFLGENFLDEIQMEQIFMVDENKPDDVKNCTFEDPEPARSHNPYDLICPESIVSLGSAVLYFEPGEAENSGDEASDADLSETSQDLPQYNYSVESDDEKGIYDIYGNDLKIIANYKTSKLINGPNLLNSSFPNSLLSHQPFRWKSRENSESPASYNPPCNFFTFFLQNSIEQADVYEDSCCPLFSFYPFTKFSDETEVYGDSSKICSRCFLKVGFLKQTAASAATPITLALTGQNLALPKSFQLRQPFVQQIHRNLFSFRFFTRAWTDEDFLYISEKISAIKDLSSNLPPDLSSDHDEELLIPACDSHFLKSTNLNLPTNNRWKALKLYPSFYPVDFLPQTWSMTEQDPDALLSPAILCESLIRPFLCLYDQPLHLLKFWARAAVINRPFEEAPDFFNEFFNLGCTGNKDARNEAMRLHYFWQNLQNNKYNHEYFRKLRRRYPMFRGAEFFSSLPGDLVDLICSFSEEQEFWRLPKFYEEIVFEHARNFTERTLGEKNGLRKVAYGNQELYAELSRELPNVISYEEKNECPCDMCLRNKFSSKAESQLLNLKRQLVEGGIDSDVFENPEREQEMIDYFCLFMPKAWNNSHHLALRLPRLWGRFLWT
jgi:hypothetical protein